LIKDEQSSELTDERPGSLIDLPTVKIRGTNLELKLSWCMALRRPASRMIQRDLHISSKQGTRPEVSNMTIAFQPSSTRRSRSEASNVIPVFQDQTRVASLTYEIYVFKKTMSDTRVFINKSHIFSFQHQSMSLLLQSVQQYASKSNRQLYWFNNIPANKSKLR